MARCLREIDCLLAPSRFAQERLQADGVRCPITVLPHFVPLSPARIEVEQPPNDGRPYFLFVGRLEKLKGVQDLIPLFAEYRDADLVVVGDGNYAAILREKARGLKNVKFLGQVHPSEISALYRYAIAVMAPSLCYEVFPLIVAEALAHGTPVIGRRIGAVTEVIENSGGGFTFDTLGKCRNAMERLQRDPGLRREMGARGRRTAFENWTVEVHLDRYLQLARSLIRQGPHDAFTS
jgi:glycosyltransferase involved in cell wall biosynthesis